MSTLPIHCHNCLSQKREFFVYLQCKHFICMSCCLFMANLQTLTVRCCHRQTKMSQQLVRTIFEQIHARKALMEIGEIVTDSFIRDFNPKIDPNELITYKVKEQLKSNIPDVVFKRTSDQFLQGNRVLSSLLQSKQIKDTTTDKNLKQYQNSKQKLAEKSRQKHHHLKQKAKQIELQQSQVEKYSKQGRYKKSIEKQNERSRQKKVQEKFDENVNEKVDKKKQTFIKRLQLIEQFDPMQYSVMRSAAKNNFQSVPRQETEAQNQSPTFKQAKLTNSDPKPNHSINQFSSTYQQARKNYQYWKNYDSTKDRILAKLNHHQYKMKSLIKEHYY